MLLWQSDEMRDRPPTVMDEVRNGLYFFETTLFDLVPQIYREMERALAETYPGEAFTCPLFCVTARGSAATATAIPMSRWRSPRRRLRAQKDQVLELYDREVEALYDHLTFGVDARGL